MERIWAPWRMSYISNTEHEDGCIFCLAWESSDDQEKLVLVRRQHSLIMLNRYPYTCGHLMVAPVRHTAEMNDLDDDQVLDLIKGVRQACDLLRKVAHPGGINIGMNLGKAAGAGVEEHLHIHVVPRWNGDTNFMTVTGSVRVIPEGLMESYARLAEVLRTDKP
ncbi:MAG: HIT family hydrolase [Geobacter sp.]|nr:MAG: HIT family hydrolase [Geobacter sp.]